MTSNQVQKVLGSISKLLECAICLDLLKNPIATRCHHHFCRFCITEFLKTKTHVPCPLCKEPVTRRSLQDQDRLSDIVEHVRGLITAYQEDTGEFFSPSRGHLGTDFFPCTPEPIFPRETTSSKRQARRGGKQATGRVDSPGDAVPAGSHAQHEETTEKLETRLHPPALHLRNTGSTGTRNIRKTRRSRQDHVPSHGGEERVGDGDRRESDERRMSALEQEGEKLESDERHMSDLEQEAALLKYLVEGSCGVNKGMTVGGYSVGTDEDSSIKVLSGVGGTGDASDERSTGQREARDGEGNDKSCDGAVVIDVDECLNNETKSVEAKTLGNKEIVERKGDNSCIETMDIDMNECFKTETISVGNSSTVGSKGFSPVCVGVEEKDGRLTRTSEKHVSRIEQILQLTPETEYEGERCGSDVSGDGGLLFQSQEVKKKEKPIKSKLSIYTGRAARGTPGGKNKIEATQKSQYETDFHEGSPLSSMDAPNLTKDFHSVGPVKTYSKAQVRKHQKSSMVAQWIEEAQHATDKGNFSQNDSLASNHCNMVSRNTENCEPIAINVDSEVENFGFSISESDAAGGSRPNVANSVEGIQESRQKTQAPPANRRRMFKTRGTKETEVVSTGKKTTELELPSSDPYEFKSSQTVKPKQKIQKQRGRKPGKKKGNKFSLKMADLQTKEASSSEVGGGVESDMTTKKDKSKATKHVHFALKSPDQELSSLIEKIGDAEDHDFAFCTQDAVSNMAEQGGDGAQLVEGFGDVMHEDIEMIDCDDTVKGSFGNGPTDNLKSQTTNSSSSNSNDTEKSQTMSIIPPTPMLSAATGQPVRSIPPSHMAKHRGQVSKVTTDPRNDEVHLTDSDSCSQMPLPIPRKKSKSAGRETKTDAEKLDVGDVASLAESSGQTHISLTPSVELVHQQDVNTARQDNDVTQDDLPSSGNSSSTEDLNISLENTQFEEANLDIQPDEIKKHLSQMSEDSQLSKAEGCPGRHRDGSTVKDADGDKTPSQGRPSSSTSKQRNTEERQSVVSLNQAPSQCGLSSAGRIHHKAQERQCIVSDNPGCALADQCSEDEVETIAADTATTMCNVPHNSHNSHSVTTAENMGAANSGSVIAKQDEDSCEDSGMAVGIEKLGVPDGKSQSEDATPESIEEESVNLIEDTAETNRGRSTRSLRTRAGRHEAAGSATTCKSRVSRRSSNRNKDPVIEIACSDTEEAVAICNVTDSRQEKQKLKDPVPGICHVDSQVSTLPTSLPVGCDELTLPPDVCVGDDQEAADVVEVDGGAAEASVDVPETVTESLSLLEQPDEQDVTPGRSGEASTLESVSILKNSDIDFKTSRTRNKNNQQKDSTGKEIRQNTQAFDRRSKPQKRKRLEAGDGDEDTSALHQLQDSAEAPSIPEVSSAPVTITLDDSDDEPLVIHRPKRKCFSLDGSPLRARSKESRKKLSRRAKPSAKKSLEVEGTCVNVDHEPMDTDVRGTVESSNCKGHSLDKNSGHDKKSEFDIVSVHHKQQCVDDTPQLVNTISDSSQVQESMEDIFNRNTEQSWNIVVAGADDASQNTLVPTCNDDDVDSPTCSPEQATVKERKSQFLDADSSDSDSPQTPRSVKKGVKAARGLASLKKKQPREESASSPIVISSSKSSSGRMPDSVNQDIRVQSQSTSSQERCPPAKQQLSLTDSECVGPTPSDVTHAGPGSGSRSRKMKGADSMRRKKNVLASDNEDLVSGCELSGRSKGEGNGLKQRHKGERASRVSLPLIHPSTKYKAKSKRRTKHVLSSDDDDEVAAVESSGCELSGRSKSEPSGHKRRYRVNCEINLPTVQSSIEDKADDDIVVLDDFEEPAARTECSSSDEEFVLRDDDEVIRKADMPEGDAMFADLPQTSSPVHASSPVPDPEDESDEAPVGVRKTSRHAIITDSDNDDNDDDDDENDDGDQQMNFISSSAFSSQSDVLTTQQQGKLEKDLEKMREEIRRLEAMKDDGAGEDVDGTMVEVAEDVAEADIVEDYCKVSTPDVIPASNKTKDGDDSSSDDDLFLSPRSPSPPPDFDRLPKPRKSAEIIKAFEIIEKFKSPDRSKSSRSRTVLSPLQTGNLGKPRSEKIVLITSGLNREQATSVQEFSKVTGSVFFPKFNKTVTHLVVKKAAGESHPVCDRTLKYFQGIVGKCWVVSFDWVRDSLLANKPLPEDKYEIVGDTVIVEDHHGPRRSRTSDKKLFSGFTLTCIGVSDEMTKDDMSLLLQQGGATLADDPWELGKMAAAIPLIIRCLDTEDEAPTKSEVEHFNCFYKHNRLITVSREWVLDSISTWRLQPLDDYVLNNIKNIVLPF
ncbi:serine-rich adhesin for platelets-like [Haliotis rufescens]|uniref:serine-rich adhesin for platelets-like n=1 Tax=Haliotis rufescens TaxID=6454 RepID=UPI00201E8C6F|nr:serine-rich adhesin for platelets-like [Haliotis rufescens]